MDESYEVAVNKKAPDWGDDIDSSGISFAVEAVDDATVEMLPLFPEGKKFIRSKLKARKWRKLFREE